MSKSLSLSRAAVVFAVFVLLLSGCGRAGESGSDTRDNPAPAGTAQAGDNGATHGNRNTVSTAAGTARVEAFGTVSAETTRSVSLDFPARVTEVPVETGQRLSRGQTVFLLDMSEFEGEIDALRDELTVARLEIDALRSDRQLEQARIRADIAFAERRLAEEEAEYARRETRYRSGAMSRIELAEYRHNLERQRKDVDDLRLSLDRAESTLRIDAERARARALETTIGRMRTRTQTEDLNGSAVVFPFDDGVVTGLTLSPGDRLEAGQTAFRAVDLRTLFVEADVLEEFIRDVAVGAAVEIVPVADRTRAYSGTVLRIPDAAVSRNNETVVPVHVSIDDADEFLRHGFNVDVYIHAEPRR